MRQPIVYKEQLQPIKIVENVPEKRVEIATQNMKANNIQSNATSVSE